jgi:cytochrome c oxidase assembly factor CtaG
LSPHGAIVLLFVTGTIGDLLGLTLALANRVVYPYYARVTNPWGLSPVLDQHLSGVVMLASGTLVTFAAIVAILAAAVSLPDSRPVPPPASRSPYNGSAAPEPDGYMLGKG